jgi:site-specific recombinase XerD
MATAAERATDVHRLPQYGDQFLQEMAASPRTVERYRLALEKFIEFLVTAPYADLVASQTRDDNSPDQPPPTPAPYPVRVLRDDVLARFYGWLVQGGLTGSAGVCLAATRRFLVWLDALDRLPLEFQLGKAESRLRAARGRARRKSYAAAATDPRLPQIVSYYENMALPDGPSGRIRRLEILRDRAVVHTLYASAGRVSEVAALTRRAVVAGEAPDGRLLIRDDVRVTGKGGKARLILLDDEARNAIAAYLSERGNDGRDALFVSHRRGKASRQAERQPQRGQALSRASLWNIVKRAVRALGLAEDVSPHDFRHYRAQQLLHEGMDIEVLQAYLGHASVATTRSIYAPETHVSKIKDQLATFGRRAADAAAAAGAEAQQ